MEGINDPLEQSMKRHDHEHRKGLGLQPWQPDTSKSAQKKPTIDRLEPRMSNHHKEMLEN